MKLFKEYFNEAEYDRRKVDSPSTLKELKRYHTNNL